jgi:glycosyltransferase involved in cell wall biosynthesis
MAMASTEIAPAKTRRLERIAYLAGPGDVVGTYRHWKQGHSDPSVPKATYSGMFYQEVDRRGLDALVLHAHENREEASDGRFAFGSARGAQFEASGLRYHRAVLTDAVRTARQVNAFEPDVVLMSDAHPFAILPLLSRRSKVVLSVHNTFWPCGEAPGAGARERVSLSLMRLALRRIDAGICTSDECRRQVAALASHAVPLLVERPRILPSGPPRPEGGPGDRLLYLGRIEADKGVFLLVEAFEAIAGAHPGATLTFVGGGSALAALRDRIAASPYAASIRADGPRGSEGVSRAFAEADLLVCPSLRRFNEGMAMVCLEAAAHGVPAVVSSSVPAAEALGEAGLVFASDDRAALSSALSRVLGDPDKLRSMARATRPVAERLRDGSDEWERQLAKTLDALEGA